MTNADLVPLNIPAKLLPHHGNETEALQPIPHSRAATTLLQNSQLVISEAYEDVVEALYPLSTNIVPELRKPTTSG